MAEELASIESRTIETEEVDMAEPAKRQGLADKIQGWVRTLWPLIAAVGGLFLYMKDQERDNAVTNALQTQRIEVLESCQSDMQSAIVELQDAQDATNQAIATLNANVVSLNGNVIRIINILDE